VLHMVCFLARQTLNNYAVMIIPYPDFLNTLMERRQA